MLYLVLYFITRPSNPLAHRLWILCVLSLKGCTIHSWGNERPVVRYLGNSAENQYSNGSPPEQPWSAGGGTVPTVKETGRLPRHRHWPCEEVEVGEVPQTQKEACAKEMPWCISGIKLFSYDQGSLHPENFRKAKMFQALSPHYTLSLFVCSGYICLVIHISFLTGWLLASHHRKALAITSQRLHGQC